MIIPQGSRSNNYAPAVGVGVGAAIILKLLDAIKLGPAAILPPMIISLDSKFKPADGYANPETL